MWDSRNTNCCEILLLILTCFVFDQDYEGLWEEDGCYNTSLYQKTAGYHTYQQVLVLCFLLSSFFVSFKQSIHHCLQFSTGMSVTMILVAALGLLGNTFSIIVLAR